jgi:hypothetical protein
MIYHEVWDAMLKVEDFLFLTALIDIVSSKVLGMTKIEKIKVPVLKY